VFKKLAEDELKKQNEIKNTQEELKEKMRLFGVGGDSGGSRNP
jgi:hypothetical protein